MVFRPSRGDGPTRNGSGVRQVPDIGAGTIPAAWYTDPDRYERERVEVFRRSWLIVGRTDQVPRAGDHIAWEGHGETIVVTRRADGGLAGFHNVCQHRGARLVVPEAIGEPSGAQRRRFVCNWHGWVYDQEGAVVGVPDRADFAGEQLDGLCAPAVAVDSWGGWIWVYLDPHDAMPTLADWLGTDIANDLGRYEMERMRVHALQVFELDVNWKAVVDGFNEMYHIEALHHVGPEAAKDGRESSFFVFGRNGMMVVPLGPGLTALRETGDHLAHAICHYSIFPNSVFNNGPLDLQLFHPVPLSVDRTRFECWNMVYVPEPDDPDAESYERQVDAHWAGLQRIVGEDLFIFGEVGATRRSMGYSANRFNERECKPTAFHRHIDNILEGIEQP